MADLLALLTCGRVEMDDGGRQNVIGIFDHAIDLDAQTPFQFTVYARFRADDRPHRVALAAYDLTTGHRYDAVTAEAQDASGVNCISDTMEVPATTRGVVTVSLTVDGQRLGTTRVRLEGLP